jgi:hypothetical protein
MKKREEEGYLAHSIIDDKTTSKALLDDYAYLIRASIDLYSTTLNIKYMDKAIILTEKTLENFYDPKKERLYLNQGNELERHTNETDGAYPSGTSIMIQNLIKLHELTDIEKYRDTAVNISNNILPKAFEHPHHYINTLSESLLWDRWIEIVIAPGKNRDTSETFIKKLSTMYLPNKLILIKTKENRYLPKHIKYIENKEDTIYYICENKVCKKPTNNIMEAIKTLEENIPKIQSSSIQNNQIYNR